LGAPGPPGGGYPRPPPPPSPWVGPGRTDPPGSSKEAWLPPPSRCSWPGLGEDRPRIQDFKGEGAEREPLWGGGGACSHESSPGPPHRVSNPRPLRPQVRTGRAVFFGDNGQGDEAGALEMIDQGPRTAPNHQRFFFLLKGFLKISR